MKLIIVAVTALIIYFIIMWRKYHREEIDEDIENYRKAKKDMKI